MDEDAGDVRAEERVPRATPREVLASPRALRRVVVAGAGAGVADSDDSSAEPTFGEAIIRF